MINVKSSQSIIIDKTKRRFRLPDECFDKELCSQDAKFEKFSDKKILSDGKTVSV